MKKIFAQFFLIFLLTQSLFAKENFFSKYVNLNLEPYFTTRFGQQNEFVFTENSAGETKKLSELNWKQKPLFFGGAKIEAGICGFNLSFKYQEAIPSLNCGSVLDSDWINLTLQKWSTNESIASLKTNYSESSCTVERYYNWILELNYLFTLKNECKLKFFGQFDYSFSSFLAQGGSYWYGKETSQGYYDEYTSVQNPGTLTGDVLKLERVNYIFWLGLSAEQNLTSHIKFFSNFAVCPFIFTDSLDTHFLTGYYYLDKMQAFFSGVKFLCGTNFSLSPKSSLKISVQTSALNSLYGISYAKSSSSNSKFSLLDTTSGASFFYADFIISFNHKF